MVYQGSQYAGSDAGRATTMFNHASGNGTNLNPPPMNPAAQNSAVSFPPNESANNMDPRMYCGAQTVSPLRPQFPPNAVLLSVAGTGP